MAPFGKIYSYPNNPRVVKAQAAANLNGLELEIPEFKMMETNKTPEFLAKFPLGKVPAFEGADGTLLVESDAITQYIAESGPAAQQLMGATPAQRALIQQWILFADGEAIAPVVQLVLPRVGFRAFDAATETAALEKLERSLAYLEKALVGRTWIATEDKLSQADITVASALQWGFVFAIDAEMRAKYPNLMSWYKRTIEAEGVKQAFGEQKYIEKRETPQA
ncbi:glutathione S-transferase [Aspergillus ambiguus]|uniref:glutathione S-transferase family protein n=1 Tax=Aspergillus ambiguus TaxID=176160 RepID=UPI003CCD6E27